MNMSENDVIIKSIYFVDDKQLCTLHDFNKFVKNEILYNVELIEISSNYVRNCKQIMYIVLIDDLITIVLDYLTNIHNISLSFRSGSDPIYKEIYLYAEYQNSMIVYDLFQTKAYAEKNEFYLRVHTCVNKNPRCIHLHKTENYITTMKEISKIIEKKYDKTVVNYLHIMHKIFENF